MAHPHAGITKKGHRISPRLRWHAKYHDDTPGVAIVPRPNRGTGETVDGSVRPRGGLGRKPGRNAVYRVFQAIDELVTILEEARGVPMTSGCVVPRGDILELLDEVRDAIPAELDDAQDVLDRRDEIVAKAQHEGEQTLNKADAQAEKLVTDTQSEADRLLAEAKDRADRMVADAEAEAQRVVDSGRAEYAELVGRAQDEADRMLQAGRMSYERAVEEGQAEQARLVSQTDVVQAAHAESARVIDAAQGEVDRLRAECDAYVDGKLGEFEDLLAHVLRTVGKGRSRLQPPMAGVNAAAGVNGRAFDYRD
jgi:cell division septum initiation protein DivIVA